MFNRQPCSQCLPRFASVFSTTGSFWSLLTMWAYVRYLLRNLLQSNAGSLWGRVQLNRNESDRNELSTTNPLNFIHIPRITCISTWMVDQICLTIESQTSHITSMSATDNPGKLYDFRMSLSYPWFHLRIIAEFHLIQRNIMGSKVAKLKFETSIWL